jgi:hypothetical protein
MAKQNAASADAPGGASAGHPRGDGPMAVPGFQALLPPVSDQYSEGAEGCTCSHSAKTEPGETAEPP